MKSPTKELTGVDGKKRFHVSPFRTTQGNTLFGREREFWWPWNPHGATIPPENGSDALSIHRHPRYRFDEHGDRASGAYGSEFTSAASKARRLIEAIVAFGDAGPESEDVRFSVEIRCHYLLVGDPNGRLGGFEVGVERGHKTGQ